MNIRQAAEASGLAPDTIRFYERKAVLPPPPRQANGYREYTDEHLATLRLAKGLRDLGMPLEQLGDVLRTSHDGTCHELRDTMIPRLTEMVAELDRRMAEMKATRTGLDHILSGLQEMDDRDEHVPGLSGCGCVQLASPGP